MVAVAAPVMRTVYMVNVARFRIEILVKCGLEYVPPVT
jgi:hypothetical protein